MKLKRRTRRRFDDSSASSDIAFLLIIYFIVIAGFNVNKGFLMNLPAKDSTRLILRDDLLRFELNAAGEVIYQNQVRDMSFAAGEIRSAAAANPNTAVILTVDPLSPWQKVVSFVELAQDLKIDSFSFAMKKDDTGGTGS
ncbi:MAG: biopolymer transporter ExbD [Treponema sp.]|jgi:biopolymer transport protein ExbD|nr:biopolymer transporter ExbD [Treponema sp.]